MESPSKRGHSAPTSHYMLQSKTSSARNGLYLVESLAKVPMEPPPKTPQPVVKVISYSLQPVTFRGAYRTGFICVALKPVLGLAL